MHDGEFLTRAEAVLGTRKGAGGAEIAWPVNMGPILRRLLREDPERWKPQVPVQEARQRVLVEWAEQHGLKQSTVKSLCPCWLVNEKSRRCLHFQNRDMDWLDHPVFWLREGRPAVVTSAPYSFGERLMDKIDQWLAFDGRLAVSYGSGWYGYGTTQVVVWRRGRFGRVEAATPPAADRKDDGRALGN